ncbi:MAG TPA: response regulator [Chryseolinea sp.]|nr:response regulator [Chryseolinea sp.]
MTKVIKLLVAEDDNLDVIDLQRTLDRMGILYRMKVAKNGEEALEALDQINNDMFEGAPDIVLLDLNMPRMNGLEFLQIIRQHRSWRDLKVFVLTTSDELEDRSAMRDLGVSGYIVKPLKVSNTNSIDAFNLMIDLMNMQN